MLKTRTRNRKRRRFQKAVPRQERMLPVAYPRRLCIDFGDEEDLNTAWFSVTVQLTNSTDVHFPYPYGSYTPTEESSGKNKLEHHPSLINLVRDILASDGVIFVEVERYHLMISKGTAFRWSEILKPLEDAVCLHLYGTTEFVEIIRARLPAQPEKGSQP